jgi:hypothetical protein
MSIQQQFAGMIAVHRNAQQYAEMHSSSMLNAQQYAVIQE